MTITHGTNRLVTREDARLARRARCCAAGRDRADRVPPLWDGHAGERIADVLVEAL